jgi:clan AA aspartic protease (TIGR02281 family)
MVTHDRRVILLLSGTLALISVACSNVDSLRGTKEQSKSVTVTSTPNLVEAPPAKIKSATTPVNSPTVDVKEMYQRASDVAYSAALLSQSAQISEDWQLVASRWEEAISLLKKVPSSSSYYASAKPKISEYQRNLNIAKQQASRPQSPTSSGTVVGIARATPDVADNSSAIPEERPTEITPTPATKLPTTPLKANTSNSGVFQVPIKRRIRQTPVIEVTFNGDQTFEMIVDTGASGTLITQTMAQSLGIEPEGEVIANTASGQGVKFDTGMVDSIAVNGIVAQNFRVAIADQALDIGLLGHDFYGNYDISLKQNVVEFRKR